MVLLSARDLMCIKRDRVLFESLNFSLHAQQMVHLKGPNGAGKTSLLRILAGLSTASEGEVQFNHQPLHKGLHDFYQNSLFIGHKSGLNLTLSALENTQFWAHQHGIALTEEEILQSLGEMGLVGLEDLPVMQLSAGQQRRVALLRLWLKKQATIWVLDEPFTALDVQGVAMIEAKLHSHVKSGGGVILTSHQTLSAHPNLVEFELEYRF